MAELFPLDPVYSFANQADNELVAQLDEVGYSLADAVTERRKRTLERMARHIIFELDYRQGDYGERAV